MSKLPSFALVVLATALGWSKPLRANPLAEVAIQWEAPQECPGREALVSELRRDLEGSQVPSVRLAVIARVEHTQPDVWQVTIATDSVEGISDRVVKSRTCAALLDATSLIIAMMIDPETAAIHARSSDDAAGAAPAAIAAGVPGEDRFDFPAVPAASMPPATQLQPHSSTRSGSPTAAPSENSVERKAGWPIAGTIAAATAIDYGSLPGINGVIHGSLGMLYGPWRFEALFGYWLPKNHITDGSPLPGAGGEFGKLSLLGRVCNHVWRSPTFETGPCVGVGPAWFSGTANHVLQSHGSATVLKLEPDLGIIALVNITGTLALRFDLDVAVPLNRPKFGYTNGSSRLTLYETAPASVRAAMGLELNFGD